MEAGYDLVIIGGGLAGIGMAVHFRRSFPTKSFCILEQADKFGGTWAFFQFPGMRSDSDMYSYCYEFKPWTGDRIATGEEILAYLTDVFEENDLGRKILFRRTVKEINWSSLRNQWSIHGDDGKEGFQIQASFVVCATGYFRYDGGYIPDFEGKKDFCGTFVHPNSWHEKISLSGRKVVVIGSGATAATIIPEIASFCEVTMIQRTPTYMAAVPKKDPEVSRLRALGLDPSETFRVTRERLIKEQSEFYQLCKNRPELAKRIIQSSCGEFLSPESCEEFFTAPYRPWSQRIAAVPDGELFTSVSAGKVKIVNGTISRITNDAVEMNDGNQIPADVIICATGFNVNFLGDIEVTVDGKRIRGEECVEFNGCMLSGVPNLVRVTGYFVYSYTLRVEIIAEFVCEIFKEMDKTDARMVTPTLPAKFESGLGVFETQFLPNYLKRALSILPRSSSERGVWRDENDYFIDRELLVKNCRNNSLIYE